MSDVTPNISVTTPHHELNGYLATPAGDGSWPGVVIVHDVFGLSPVARGHADWLASEGFLSVVPDLYTWGGTLKCVKATMTDMMAGEGVAFDDLDAVRTWLADRPDCTGKTGVIGFCMGGRFAIFMASGHGFAASAPNYGELPDDLDEVLNDCCPMVASYGGMDKRLAGSASRLQEVLQRHAIPHDVKEYPDSYHSFMDDHQQPFTKVMCKLLALKFNDRDAADARERISTFFRLHLR